MTKRMKLNAFGLISTLVIAMAMPLMAQAGTLTIHNKNCHKKIFLGIVRDRVTVHVWDSDRRRKCTDTKVTVGKGKSKTISIASTFQFANGETLDCKYRHEAMGTVGGKRDVPGKKDSHVTCKKDWYDVCQCTRD